MECLYGELNQKAEKVTYHGKSNDTIDLVVDNTNRTIEAISKLDTKDIEEHIENTAIHTNRTEKEYWNGKYTKPENGIPKSDIANDVLPTFSMDDNDSVYHINGKEISAMYDGDGNVIYEHYTNQNEFEEHTENTDIHVTAIEKEYWNAKPSINGVTLQGNKTSMELNIEDYVLYEVSDDSESEYYRITVEQQRRIVKNPYSVLLRMHTEGDEDGYVFHFDRKQDTEDQESYYFFVTDPFDGSYCYEIDITIRDTIEESTHIEPAEETFIDIGNSVIEYHVENDTDVRYEFIHQCPPRIVVSDLDTGRTFHYWYSDVYEDEEDEDEWEKHYYISEKYISGNTVYYDEVKFKRYYEDDFPLFHVDITTGIEFVTLPTIPITSNLLKGDGLGGITSATPGEDYVSPNSDYIEITSNNDETSNQASLTLDGTDAILSASGDTYVRGDVGVNIRSSDGNINLQTPNGTVYINGATLPTSLSQLSEDQTHRVVTDIEKSSWNAKQDKPTIVEYELNEADSVDLEDNAEYYFDGSECDSVDFIFPTGRFECYIHLTTKHSGTTIYFPAETKYIGSEPQFGVGEVWEISIKNSVVVAAKIGNVESDEDEGADDE